MILLKTITSRLPALLQMVTGTAPPLHHLPEVSHDPVEDHNLQLPALLQMVTGTAPSLHHLPEVSHDPVEDHNLQAAHLVADGDRYGTFSTPPT